MKTTFNNRHRHKVALQKSGYLSQYSKISYMFVSKLLFIIPLWRRQVWIYQRSPDLHDSNNSGILLEVLLNWVELRFNAGYRCCLPQSHLQRHVPVTTLNILAICVCQCSMHPQLSEYCVILYKAIYCTVLFLYLLSHKQVSWKLDKLQNWTTVTQRSQSLVIL